MQTSTIIVLACLIAAVVAQHQESVAQEMSPDVAAYESIDAVDYERSPRTKRGLLLLKKKLLLGALGLKAAKLGALGVGAVGLAGLKSKGNPTSTKHLVRVYV